MENDHHNPKSDLSYLDRLQQGIDICRYWLELPVEHSCKEDYPIGSCEACDWLDVKEVLIEAHKREIDVQKHAK